jgi:5'-nucleotidase
MKTYEILVTNDDGIESPGLRAAVDVAVSLGRVTVAAPSHQQTASGRGLTGDKAARLIPIEYAPNGARIRAYHCDCSPALVVKHCLRTLFSERLPDLLISGINYGENVGVQITSSGTIGAALEAASAGIPCIAISKQTDVGAHLSYTAQDWTASSFFLNRFAEAILNTQLQTDVDVLKLDIPCDATSSTRWKITKQARTGYYFRTSANPTENSKIFDGETTIHIDTETLDPETDIYALAIEKLVSVTPLSVDLTSRVQFDELQETLGG